MVVQIGAGRSSVASVGARGNEEVLSSLAAEKLTN